jgi:hypothetical protein
MKTKQATKDAKPAKKAVASSASDIDAIFSSKPSTSKLPVVQAAAAETSSKSKKKRKKATAAAVKQEAGEAVEVVEETERIAPHILEATSKAKGASKPSADEESFMDSRGSKRSLLFAALIGGLMLEPGRRTEDGLPIYAVEELCGQGGDTELCPFDCECCTDSECSWSWI